MCIHRRKAETTGTFACAVNNQRRSPAIFRSTGTREIGAAKRIGAQIIESFWSDAGRGAEKLKLRNDYATIGQLLDQHQERAVQRPRTVHKATGTTKWRTLLASSGCRDRREQKCGRRRRCALLVRSPA